MSIVYVAIMETIHVLPNNWVIFILIAPLIEEVIKGRKLSGHLTFGATECFLNFQGLLSLLVVAVHLVCGMQHQNKEVSSFEKFLSAVAMHAIWNAIIYCIA